MILEAQVAAQLRTRSGYFHWDSYIYQHAQNLEFYVTEILGTGQENGSMREMKIKIRN